MTPPRPLATVAELAAWFGIDVAELNETQAELLLDAASSTVRNVCGQRLDIVVDDEVELRTRSAGLMFLPEVPVISVDAVVVVTAYGTPADTETTLLTTDWRLERGREGRLGILHRLGGYRSWIHAPHYARVTYTHGYDLDGGYAYDGIEPLPGSLKAVVLAAAARAYENPSSMRQELAGRWSGLFQGDGGVTLTAAEERIVTRFRNPSA